MYGVLRCEEVLMGEGYIIIRPDERIYITKKFGKMWAIISNNKEEDIIAILSKVKDENELRRTFYCTEVKWVLNDD